ncbi:alpha-L-fucosidase [Chitinophaga sp.]|uniref:alpha-L-fucosidase n=1 Tax=Chitinophaga sp. TaxID=1869181 RepID=UPI0031D8C106
MKKILLLILLSTHISSAQQLPKETRMEWWREARFGMFIHWGVYSALAGNYNGHPVNRLGEWIMNFGKIPVADYQTYAKQFNPTHYNPDTWVKLAKEAGMKYIVITAKHHDGFALFKTTASKWNIVDASPYGKDLLQPLAAACHKYGIKLGFYYSQAQDWVNPGGSAMRRLATQGWANPDSAAIDAYTLKNNGHWDPLQTEKPMSEYIDQVAIPQVRELLTNYGDIAVLWWDTPNDMTDEYAGKLQNLLALQPHIITNDRLKKPNFPGDYKTPEQRIPKNKDSTDWETCMTMNDTWGFKTDDHHWKSATILIRNLVDIASKGGNYLLNVGPAADGTFPEESISLLHQIGAWMKTNSEAIYGTQASPLETLPWGRCTIKKNIYYFSVFDWPSNGELTIPDLRKQIKSASLLQNGTKLKTTTDDKGLHIHIPAHPKDTIATVIKVEVAGELQQGH